MSSVPAPVGFLLVDKPSGWTSHDVVAKLRGLLRMKKIGHAGTLDPMATGLLVLAVGRATRLLRYVQDLPKEYVAQAQFGVATDSLDADGAILSRDPMPVEASEIEAVFARFVGSISQVPPMVSARKVDGRRLYELAREGKEVAREARAVTIYGIDVLDIAPSDYPEVTFRVRCSKGTYVRTLADDVARALGGRAHLTALRRLRNGSLDVGDASTIEELEKAAGEDRLLERILPPAAALVDLPGVTVHDDLSKAVRHGVAVPRTVLGVDVAESFRILDEQGGLLAVYRAEGPEAAAEVVIA